MTGGHTTLCHSLFACTCLQQGASDTHVCSSDAQIWKHNTTKWISQAQINVATSEFPIQARVFHASNLHRHHFHPDNQERQHAHVQIPHERHFHMSLNVHVHEQKPLKDHSILKCPQLTWCPRHSRRTGGCAAWQQQPSLRSPQGQRSAELA